MSQLFTPKNAERKIFRLAIFEDGIWDIQIGGMLMLLSLYPITRNLLGPVWNAVLILVLMGVLLFVGATLKRTLSTPRMGLVRFGQKQKSKQRTMQLIIFGIFLLTTALAISLIMQTVQKPDWGENTPNWLQALDMDIVFALVVVAIFSLVSAIYKIWRPFIYGLLFASSMIASAALSVYQGTESQYPFAIAGGIIMTFGLGLLLHFVRTYPIPTEEA